MNADRSLCGLGLQRSTCDFQFPKLFPIFSSWNLAEAHKLILKQVHHRGVSQKRCIRVNQDQPLKSLDLFTVPTPVVAGSLPSTLGICLEIRTPLKSLTNWGWGNLFFFAIWCLAGWWLRVWCSENLENLQWDPELLVISTVGVFDFIYEKHSPRSNPIFVIFLVKQGCFVLVVDKHVWFHFKWKHSFHEPGDASLLQASTCQVDEGISQQDHMRYKVDTYYIHPGKLTWNLKITCLKRKNHLPNLHFWVPMFNFSGVSDSSSSMITESSWLATLSTNHCSLHMSGL